jgi:hypothetical protein
VITGVTSHVLQVDGVAHVISDDGYDVLRNSSRGLDGLGGPVKPGAGLLPAALITAESADDHYVIGMRPNRLNGSGRPSASSPRACWHRETKRSQLLLRAPRSAKG